MISYVFAQNKKYIFGGLFLLSSISVLWFLLTNTFVVLKSPNDNLVVNISMPGSDYQKSMTISRGTSRWVILPKGQYNLSTANNTRDQEALYYYILRPFSKRTITLETLQQKQSIFIGSKEYGCSSAKVFYPCSETGDTVSVGNNPQNKTVPSRGTGADTEVDSEQTIIKPGGDGVLSFWKVGNVLWSTQISENSINKPVYKILSADFRGKLKNDYFSISRNNSVAVYDSSSKAVLVFRSSDDKSPKKINLEKYIDAGKSEIINLSDDSLAVALTDNVANVGEGSDSQSPSKQPDLDSDLLTVNLNSPSSIHKVGIPGKIVVDSLSEDGSGNLLVFYQLPKDSGAYIVSGNNFTPIFTPKDIDYACASKSGIYFDTKDNKIFKYEPSKQASFLVYKSQSNNITDFNCSGDEVMFGIEPDDNFAESTPRYTLGPDPQNGPRIDGFFPMDLTLNTDTYIAHQTRYGVSVGLVYDYGKDGPSSTKKFIRDSVINALKDEIVDNPDQLKQPTISFGF